jgi:hypothetical protein
VDEGRRSIGDLGQKAFAVVDRLIAIFKAITAHIDRENIR